LIASAEEKWVQARTQKMGKPRKGKEWEGQVSVLGHTGGAMAGDVAGDRNQENAQVSNTKVEKVLAILNQTLGAIFSLTSSSLGQLLAITES
jgi:hypothetical protein